MTDRMPQPRCYKCNKPTQVFGSRWCAECWYPGIDKDYDRYRALLEEGYGHYQAKVMVGWADPPGDGE